MVDANPVFPPELTDRIIDHLHDDNRSLSACSLVHRNWLPSARYHRFDRTIVKVQKLRAFRKFLDGIPAIATVITKLSFETINNSLCTLLPCNDILSTMSKLPYLRHLRFLGVRISDFEIETFSTVDLKLLHGLSMQHIWLSIQSDMMSFIALFSGLRSLHIGPTYASDFDNNITLPPNPHLEELHLTACGKHPPFTKWLKTSRPSLKTISCTITEREQVLQLKDVLALTGETVEHLELVMDSDAQLARLLQGDSLSLEPCVNLRHCHLSFRLREMCVPQCQSLPWICEIITQISSPLIETLTIKIEADNMDNLFALDSECGFRQLSPVQFTQLHALDWDRMAVILSSNKFRSLARVTFVGKGYSDSISTTLASKYPEIERLVVFNTRETGLRRSVWD